MMKINSLKLTLLLPVCFFATGCQTLPVVPHALNCDVSAELLASECTAPKPIPNDSTYAMLVDTMQADRKSLQECSVTTNTLRETLKRCNEAAREYNNKIDALNRVK